MRHLASLSLLGLFSANSWAEPCQNVKVWQDLLDIAVRSDTAVQRTARELDRASEQEGAAGQIPNPELDGKAVTAQSFGDRINEVEISLSQPLGLGGTRSSRIAQARAEIKVAESGLQAARENAYRETALALYRLSQIQSEKEILSEALNTFTRITGQFRSRPKLSPDQQVSLGLIQFALGDYRLRKSTLDGEDFELKKKVSVALACELPVDKLPLPTVRESWPELKTVDGEKDFKDSATRLSVAETEHAQADYDMAKAESWPDLKIGPVFQHTSDGGISYPSYGINFSFPLPLFSLNAGGRATALKGVLKAESSRALLRQEKRAEYEVLKDKYLRFVSSLKDALSVKEIEEKHQNTDRLFSQGLVGGTSVVEAHRQIVDFTRSKHEVELSALEALIKIRAFQGSLFEEKL